MESTCQWAIWLLGPHGYGEDAGMLGQLQVTSKRERERVSSSRIILAWVWDGSGAFSKAPMNFPSLHGLLIGPHPLARLMGLFGQALPLVTPSTILYWSGEGRSVKPVGGAML